MRCQYCNKEFLSRHVPFCKERDINKTKQELRADYLIFNIPELFEYVNLIEIYVNKKMSLPDIKLAYNIDYKNIQFMLRYYNISIRSGSEGCKLSTNKKENTCLKRYGAKNVLSKGTEKYEKRNKTIKEKYGVENVFQIKDIIDTIQGDNIYISKYNLNRHDFVSKNNKKHWSSLSKEKKHEILKKGIHSEKGIKNSINSRILNGYIIPSNELEPFKLYKRNCRKLTKKNMKILFENWDGYDYYDNEFIKDNLLLKHIDPRYPTIDHKISIYYGFKNNIEEKDICDIKNLCITKRSINSSKGIKNNI